MFRDHLVQIINAALQENLLPPPWSLIQNTLLRNVRSTTSKTGLSTAWNEDAVNLWYRTR